MPPRAVFAVGSSASRKRALTVLPTGPVPAGRPRFQRPSFLSDKALRSLRAGKANPLPEIYGSLHDGCGHLGRFGRHGLCDGNALAIRASYCMATARYLCPSISGQGLRRPDSIKALAQESSPGLHRCSIQSRSSLSSCLAQSSPASQTRVSAVLQVKLSRGHGDPPASSLSRLGGR